MLRKFFALMVSGAMLGGLLIGCSQTTESATTTTTTATTTTSTSTEASGTESTTDFSGVTLVFASDAVGSGSYNQIVEISKYLESDGGFGLVDVQPISPGGMGAPYLFESGSVDFAYCNAAPAKWASETGVLGKDPVSGYSPVIGALSSIAYINCISNDFLEKYNVSTIEEIFEQQLPLRIGCSPVGSMDAQGVYLLLECFDVTQEDLESWGGSITNQGGSENQAAMQDGRIDFYLDHTSSSSSTMAEIATTCDVTFLEWEDATTQWFVDEKGFQSVEIPADSFKGQTEAIVLPGSPDTIFCRTDLSDEVVYQFTKTLSENRDNLVATYSSMEPWDVATCMDSEKLAGLELHPGAAQYYREMGYID